MYCRFPNTPILNQKISCKLGQSNTSVLLNHPLLHTYGEIGGYCNYAIPQCSNPTKMPLFMLRHTAGPFLANKRVMARGEERTDTIGIQSHYKS